MDKPSSAKIVQNTWDLLTLYCLGKNCANDKIHFTRCSDAYCSVHVKTEVYLGFMEGDQGQKCIKFYIYILIWSFYCLQFDVNVVVFNIFKKKILYNTEITYKISSQLLMFTCSYTITKYFENTHDIWCLYHYIFIFSIQGLFKRQRF